MQQSEWIRQTYTKKQMETWKEIESILPVFKKTFSDLVDFDKFNRIAITFHSTAIEGSTLTLTESEILLDKGLTPKGKPLVHQNMVLDHFEALKFVLDRADKKSPFTLSLIQETAAAVMKSTGSTITTALGSYDVSKGDLRLNNVRAGEQYFVNYDKVMPLLEKLVTETGDRINKVKNTEDILRLSFDVHFDLVSIHPFGDGNGRTSRLIMNFVQQYHDLPIAPVFVEDRQEYIQSLMSAREQKSMKPFHDFMFSQYCKHLKSELDKFQKSQPGKGGLFSMTL